MAVDHEIGIRNGVTDLVVDSLDLGTTDANGDLVYDTLGDVEVATLALSIPAAGASASGTSTFNAITDDPSATGGTIAKFKLQDRDNARQLGGSVTATGGGGDIELTSVVVAATDPVGTSSLIYIAPF